MNPGSPPSRSPKRGEVEFSLGDKTYTAEYGVVNERVPRVTVKCELGSAATQLGGLPVPYVVRYLLQEIVDHWSGHQHSALTRTSTDANTPTAGASPSAVRDDEPTATACAAAAESHRSADLALGWQRLPGESAGDFRAFTYYRNLGEERTLQKAWEEFSRWERRVQSRQRTKCPGAWTALSSKYRWVDRAAAYDKHMIKTSNSALVGLRRLMEQRDELI